MGDGLLLKVGKEVANHGIPSPEDRAGWGHPWKNPKTSRGKDEAGMPEKWI